MNLPDERLVRRADNLARLLSDGRGAEILAELQKLALVTGARSPGTGDTGDDDVLGAWRTEQTQDGVALRRRELVADESRTWAVDGDVPAPGTANRVVLLGESSARGFLLDPVCTPASALRHRLDAAKPGGYQCVDLAQTGMDLRDLTALVRRLPTVRPDVIVLYAGNNWVLPQHTPAHLDVLADALRRGDYRSMRTAFLERIVAPGARRLLEVLARVARECAARVVVVVPEFNLRGWAPTPEFELPPLPPAELRDWTRLLDATGEAYARGEFAAVLAFTERMAELDGGTSPATGWLRGQAAERLGRPGVARQAFEASRDAVCGLLTTHTPRITTELRELLGESARQHGFDVVDLAAVLRSDPADAVPAPDNFLDYCHLSDRGVELMVAAVADRVLDLPPGSTPPGPGADGGDRAVAALLAAVHNSFYGQPAAKVAELVRAAVDGSTSSQAAAAALLDVLEARGPVWTHPATAVLAQTPHAARYLEPMLTRQAQTLGMWTLRRCLLETLRERPADRPGEPDLLSSVEQGLIDGAFRPPNHLPERAYTQATTRVSTIGFAAPNAAGGTLTVTYRTPGAGTGTAATVAVNRTAIGTLPAARDWARQVLPVPAGLTRPGVNEVTITWPLGGEDWHERRAADAAAMARGDFPMVLAVHGELFELTFAQD